MYNVALVGAGIISDSHFEGWQNIPDAEVKVIVDVNKKAAGEKAGKWKIENIETDFNKVLEDEEIDIVDICAPNFLHTEYSIKALNSKKHVICEKPIALTLADTKKILEVQKLSDKIFMVAENWYYIPVVAEAISKIKSGSIGKPFSIKSNIDFPGLKSDSENDTANNWRFDRIKSGGGILIDAGIHAVSVVKKILGMPQVVLGFSEKTNPKEEVEGNFFSMLKYEEASALFHFTNASGWSKPKFDFEILGSKGAIYIDLISQKFFMNENGETLEKTIPAKGGMTEELEHFVDCIKENKEPFSNAKDQVEALALVLAAYQSADQNGIPVSPKDVLEKKEIVQ